MPNRRFKQKLLLGPLDSGLNYDLKLALKKLGYQVTTLIFIERGYQFPVDINLMINRTSWPVAALKVIKNFFACFRYDIYHFRLGQSLLPWNFDLPIWKAMGKKVIVNFDGDDVRLSYKFKKSKYNALFAKYNHETKGLAIKKILRFYWIRLWADEITVVTPDLLEFAPGAKLVFNLVPISIKKANQKKPKPSGKITVLHAPTDPKIKGTAYIEKAVRRLKKERYPVELAIFANQPHAEIDSYYRQADIVVDQLLVGAMGLVSLEGMMYGKPVVCYIRDDLRSYYPKELPVISANSDTIYKVLKDLIVRKNEFKKIGQAGEKYVKKYHYPNVVAKKWQSIYEGISSQESTSRVQKARWTIFFVLTVGLMGLLILISNIIDIFI